MEGATARIPRCTAPSRTQLIYLPYAAVHQSDISQTITSCSQQSRAQSLEHHYVHLGKNKWHDYASMAFESVHEHARNPTTRLTGISVTWNCLALRCGAHPCRGVRRAGSTRVAQKQRLPFATPAAVKFILQHALAQVSSVTRSCNWGW